jgi:hypothetical protein
MKYSSSTPEVPRCLIRIPYREVSKPRTQACIVLMRSSYRQLSHTFGELEYYPGNFSWQTCNFLQCGLLMETPYPSSPVTDDRWEGELSRRLTVLRALAAGSFADG